jgi:hypothetical protein
MAASIKTEGSQATSGTTEHSLATVTDAGTYVLVVDLADMVDGDEMELRIKTKLTSGDSSQLAYYQTYKHAQAILNVYSIPVPAPIEFVATMKMTVGGGTFIWAIYSL